MLCRNSPRNSGYNRSGVNRMPQETDALDPDNSPPRSRLFIVVPKNANGSQIESRMAEFPGMQYCKTDLIASKGIVFVKYDTSSNAYSAMEAVQASGTISGYRVKVMIAEPKNRRNNTGLPADGRHSLPLSSHVFDSDHRPFIDNSESLLGSNALSKCGFSEERFGSGFPQGLTSLMSSITCNSSSFDGQMTSRSEPPLHSFELSYENKSMRNETHYTNVREPLDLNSVPPGTRLFVVVQKTVNEEDLASIFRCYPGMEYINLKRDRVTGRSKGYAYVNYYTLESAKAAQAQLNGIEFPRGSGSMLKVLFAAPLTVSGQRRPDLASISVSSGNSDLQNSPAKGFINTPSQDTANTNFQLPSPNSGDSVGQFGYGAQHLQNSARTDHSSTSRESLLSPISSPLGKNQLSGPEFDDITRMEKSLVDLKLDFGLFDNGGKCSNMIDGISFGDPPAANAVRDSIESSFGSFTGENTSVREVYSILEKPLNSQGLHNIFEQCGDVEKVELLSSKVARIRYSNADAANNAIIGVHALAGVLTVSSSPPHM